MPYDFRSHMGRERQARNDGDVTSVCANESVRIDDGCLPVCGSCLRYQVTPSGLARCQRSSLLVTEGDYCSKFELG